MAYFFVGQQCLKTDNINETSNFEALDEGISFNKILDNESVKYSICDFLKFLMSLKNTIRFFTKFDEMLSSGTCTFPTEFFFLGCCVMV